MSTKIGNIEDALIALVTATFGERIRNVEWAPPDWTEDFLKQVLVRLPGALIIFYGFSNPEQGSATLKVQTNWGLVFVSRQVDVKQRARGNEELGCYEMAETLAPIIDGWVLGDIGTFNVVELDTTDSLKHNGQGLMVQELSLSMMIDLTRELDASSIVPFETFHDSFNVGQLPGAPTLEDTVELEQ